MNDYITIRNKKTGETKQVLQSQYVTSNNSSSFYETADKYLSYAVDPLTFGFGDEIVGALASTLTGNSYEEERDKTRNNRKQVYEENPVAATVGDIALSYGSGKGFLSLANKISKFKNMGTLAKGATAAMAEGGLYGAGNSESSGTGIIKDAAKGLALGAAGDIAGSGIGKAGGVVSDKLRGASSYYAKILNESGVATDEVQRVAQRLAKVKNKYGKDLTVIEGLQPNTMIGRSYQPNKLATNIDNLMENSPQGSEMFRRFVGERNMGSKDRLIFNDLQQAYQLPTDTLLSGSEGQKSLNRFNMLDTAWKEPSKKLGSKYNELLSNKALSDEAMQDLARKYADNPLVEEYVNVGIEKAGDLNGRALHRARMGIDEDLKKFRDARAANVPLSVSEAEREGALKSARISIDETLKSDFPEIKQLDAEFAEIASVTRDLQYAKIKKIVENGKGSPAERLVRNDKEISKFYNKLDVDTADELIDRIDIEDKMYKIPSLLGSNSKTARALLANQDNTERLSTAFDIATNPTSLPRRALSLFTNNNPIQASNIVEQSLQTGDNAKAFLNKVVEDMVKQQKYDGVAQQETRNILKAIIRVAGGN